jgi:hypothetical protein
MFLIIIRKKPSFPPLFYNTFALLSHILTKDKQNIGLVHYFQTNQRLDIYHWLIDSNRQTQKMVKIDIEQMVSLLMIVLAIFLPPIAILLYSGKGGGLGMFVKTNL